MSREPKRIGKILNKKAWCISIKLFYTNKKGGSLSALFLGHQVFIREGQVGIRSDNQVIQHLDIQNATGLDHLFSEGLISSRGFRIAGWMVVGKDY